VHLDSSERTAERLRLAVGMATRFGARLAGLFAEGASMGASAVGRRSPQNMARAAEEARTLFEERTREAGLTTDWWQLEQGDYAHVVGWTVVCCRYVDLALFGQHDPEHEAALPSDMVDQVLLESGRPTLVVPYIGSYAGVGRRVLVAWTGSRESARAINDAIPFMEGAEEVTVLSLQQAPGADGGAPVPRLDITEHLRAHGIEAAYERVITGEASAVDLVLNRAADAGADLTVMGAYAQSGFPFLPRSTTTRDILRTMTTPVLLSR
jgi:nucleotide-binding universal stress UspA family protein